MKVLSKIKTLPKKTLFYLASIASIFLIVCTVNLWFLLFTQFGLLNDEYDNVSKLEDYIYNTSELYSNAISSNPNFTQEDLQKILDDTVKKLSNENQKAARIFSAEADFNHTALSNNSFKFCYGFKTTPEFREKYGIIRTEEGFDSDWTFKWMPSWIKIKKESSNQKDSIYVDCYVVDFQKVVYKEF